MNPATDQGARPRLRFREFTPRDRETLLTFVHNPGQHRYMVFDLSTENAVDEFLELVQTQAHAEPRSEWHWAVEEVDRPGMVGCVDLMIDEDSPTSAELGYWLLQEFWGRGFAVEASRLALDHGFQVLGLHRIWGKCHVENRASSRVMEKLGMVREAVIREHFWLRDHFRSSLLYAVLSQDWPPAPALGNPVDHRGRPIRLIRSERGHRRLAVFYPGMNYTPMAPLFFFLGQALEDAGWDILALDYRYNEDEEFQNASDEVRDRWFARDSEAVGRWVAQEGAKYARIAIVTKSLGTTMLLNQLEAGLVDHTACLVWMTPGTTAPRQFSLLQRLSQRSLLVYGSADPHFLKAQEFVPTESPRVRVVEISGAGHIFEAEGNVQQSIANLAKVVRAVSEFLEEEVS